jgi:hypothetical protein
MYDFQVYKRFSTIETHENFENVTEKFGMLSEDIIFFNSNSNIERELAV